MGAIHIPQEAARDFQVFRQYFDRVTTQWVLCGEETESSVKRMREGLQAYIAALADLDQQQRLAELNRIFTFWQDLHRRIVPHGLAVRPVLSVEAERRAARAGAPRK